MHEKCQASRTAGTPAFELIRRRSSQGGIKGYVLWLALGGPRSDVAAALAIGTREAALARYGGGSSDPGVCPGAWVESPCQFLPVALPTRPGRHHATVKGYSRVARR